MMHRYIAFAWDQRKGEETSLAKSLVQRLESKLPESTCVFSAEGLQVFNMGATTSISRAYLLKQNGGVVLGKLFERRMDAGHVNDDITFNDQESRKVRQSSGRRLVENCWGRYVALLRDDCGTGVRILRDPTGALPCLLLQFRGIDVVCSHIDDCATLGLINSTINWDHIAAYLWHSRLVTSHTGLNDVRQVQAGECAVIGADSDTSSFYWSPDRICSTRVVEDRQQAMQELRQVIQTCVSAWASCYSSILHELSGGLDSAIVLACLSRSSSTTTVACENYFTRSATGDEREFAQKAAKRAGVELIETPLRSSDRALESMLNSEKFASPALTRLVPEVESTREHLIEARGIEAIFSGQGGDHFFQQMRTPLIAAEYAWRHGLRPDLLTIITDTSRFTRAPIWSVAATVFTSGILHRNQDPYDQLRPPMLVSDAARDAMSSVQVRHRWIDSAGRIPGSKVLQIFNLVDSQNFYRVPCHYADIVHPLISQPIIELCLQVPCYVLTYDGIDRALVREAFTGSLPPEIARRTIKGATTSYVSGLLVSNLPFIREYLLEGILAQKGVLDRRKTEASLSESDVIRSTSRLLFPLLNAIRAEAWLRTWISDAQRAAA